MRRAILIILVLLLAAPVSAQMIVGGGAYSAILDNGDAGTSYSGASWSASSFTAGYYGTDYQYHAVDTSSDYYQYQFTGLPSGTYAIYEQHPAYITYSSVTPVEVLDNTTSRGTSTIDQSTGGGAFNLIGTYSITSGTCNVRIKTNAASGDYVIADAIKVVLQ